MSETIIIALDGPAASGKGTLGRKLATHFDFAYLDTGTLYRGIADLLLKAGGTSDNLDEVLTATKNLSLDDIDKVSIRADKVGTMAAKVATYAEVREAVLQIQRDFATTPPLSKQGAVLDGRDIGTVVCPHAQAKLFITASDEVRAKRRWLELKATDPTCREADVLASLRQRDESDKTRTIAPLRQAENALLLDTSKLSIEEAFKTALAFVISQIEC